MTEGPTEDLYRLKEKQLAFPLNIPRGSTEDHRDKDLYKGIQTNREHELSTL